MSNFARVANERVRGLLVERGGLLKAVALLKPSERPLRLWAYHAIKGTIIEADCEAPIVPT